MHWPRWRQVTEELLREYDVRTPHADVPARTLSGGNQQKLVLARELDGDPRVIVADNPTRGLDIRATADVHARLYQAAARGIAVIVYSSDLDEILALAARVIAVHGGRLSEVATDRGLIGRAILGLS
jgi:simple sugar transport system ATP-binding protein